jgi:hypothetical protein
VTLRTCQKPGECGSLLDSLESYPETAWVLERLMHLDMCKRPGGQCKKFGSVLV